MGPSGARRGFGTVPMLPSQISPAGEQQSARRAKAPSNPQGEPIHSIPTQLEKTPQVLQVIPVGFVPGKARIVLPQLRPLEFVALYAGDTP